jgi:hypothetical protein
MKKTFQLLMILTVAGHALADETPRKLPPEPEPPPPPCESPAERAASFRPGEEMVYQVKWGLFDNSGEIRFRTSYETAPAGRFQIATETRTKGMLRFFHSVDNRIETYLDPREWRLLETTVHVQEGRKKSHKTTMMDYARGMALCTDHLNPEKSKERELAYPCLLDTISSIFRARTWDMKPGDAKSVLVQDDGKKYLLTVYARAIETVKTPSGEFTALRIEPRMDYNPKGFFKRSSEVYVWISQDRYRIPVKISSKLKLGAAAALLASYTPFTAETAVATAPERRSAAVHTVMEK